jgi:hypothetical protein
MGAASERRALLLEADDSYNPFLAVDVNEYLIGEFPTLTIKQRTSVVHLCQSDEDFDYSSIHDQIDEKLYEHAETNPEVILGDVSADTVVESDDDESDVDEDDQSVYDLMYTHLEEEWPQLTEDQMDSISNSLVEKQDELQDFFDVFVFDYAKANDPSIDVSEMEDTETE